MKKKITACLLPLFFIALNMTAQATKKQKKNAVTPFFETTYQLGLCGEYNPVGFIAGIEKPLAKHLVISYDVQFWKTAYEVYCCDIFSQGNYMQVIPSVKVKFDPGKPGKGFFAGGGLGYVFARDRGTEQAYESDPVTGAKTFSSEVKQGNWDFNSIAPSFSWGVGFKIKGFPAAIINTNYFGKTTWGWGPVSAGVGFRFGLSKVSGSCCKGSKKCK
ncbi:MAG: hypothetical protein ACT4OJ_10480 [Bacteroidota bacterium]